jgi:hypothetical protein
MKKATGFDSESNERPASGLDAGALVDAAAMLGVAITVDLARVLGIEDLAGAFDAGMLAAGLEAWL